LRRLSKVKSKREKEPSFSFHVQKFVEF